MKNIDPLRLVEAVEARRAMRNTIGRMAAHMMLRQDHLIFDECWSSREDICFGVNEGWYQGREAVKGYYDSMTQYNRLRAQLYQAAFPEKLREKSIEELNGVGSYDGQHLTTPVIEVAGDGLTGKGVWIKMGSHDHLTPAGPSAFWHMGCYACDFVKEDGQWKIWHLLSVDEVNCRCDQLFGCQPEAEEPLPEFAAIADFKLARPNVPQVNHQAFNADRPRTRLARLPEPYEHFEDTFSYGI